MVQPRSSTTVFKPSGPAIGSVSTLPPPAGFDYPTVAQAVDLGCALTVTPGPPPEPGSWSVRDQLPGGWLAVGTTAVTRIAPDAPEPSGPTYSLTTDQPGTACAIEQVVTSANGTTWAMVCRVGNTELVAAVVRLTPEPSPLDETVGIVGPCGSLAATDEHVVLYGHAGHVDDRLRLFRFAIATGEWLTVDVPGVAHARVLGQLGGSVLTTNLDQRVSAIDIATLSPSPASGPATLPGAPPGQPREAGVAAGRYWTWHDDGHLRGYDEHLTLTDDLTLSATLARVDAVAIGEAGVLVQSARSHESDGTITRGAVTDVSHVDLDSGTTTAVGTLETVAVNTNRGGGPARDEVRPLRIVIDDLGAWIDRQRLPSSWLPG